MKLRNAIFIVSAPIAIISIALVVQVTYYYTERGISAHLNSEAESTAKSLQEITHQILDFASGNLVLYGNFEVFQRYLKYKKYGLHEEADVTRQEIYNTFKRLVNLRDDYVAMGFADSKRRMVTSYSKQKSYTVGDFTELKLYASKTKDLSVSDVVKKDDRQHVIRIAYRMTPHEAGSLFLDMDCDKMLAAISHVHSSSKTNIYFVDRSDSIFYSSSPKHQDVASKILSEEEIGGGGTGMFNVFGSEILYSQLYPVESFGWAIGFIVEKDLVYGALAQLKRYSFLIITIAALGMFLVVGVLSRQISKPVEFILDDINGVATEESETTMVERHFHIQEFLQIRGALDKMRERLIGMKEKIAEDASLVAIGQTASQIAHDVRKPLTALKALLAMLSEKDNDEAFIAKMVRRVDHTINRTNSMLADILEFSKDKASLKCKQCDPQSILSASIGDALRGRDNLDIQLEYALRHRNYLHVDGDRIIRVLTNILDNAVEAMGGKGKIWIRTEDMVEGNELFSQVSVGNNGPVIPPDVQKKLFEPYFTHGKKGGTGLGLAICQKIIEMHGGRISLTSGCSAFRDEPLTEFVVRLPASRGDLRIDESELVRHSDELKQFREEETAREAYGDAINIAAFRRIYSERGRLLSLLIVDDEPLFRETVHSLIDGIKEVRDHVKVVEAESAETALSVLAEREFDYVITDISMGFDRMNGYDLARTIMKTYPSIAVLIHSNKRREELDRDIRAVASERFMGFLPKPMRAEEMLQFLACKTFEGIAVGGVEAIAEKSVLVVNDDEDISIAVKAMLIPQGVQVITASNVSDALTMLTNRTVDLILSDINLGANEPTGYDLLKAVRGYNDNLPFYFLSGFSSAEEWPKAKGHGATGYLQLPIEMDDLRRVVSSPACHWSQAEG